LPSCRVAELPSVVEAKRDLNSQLMMVSQAAVAVNPFKLIEDAEWTARVEKLSAMCQRSNTQFTPPEPPVDYLSDEERDEGTHCALEFREALEFAALTQKSEAAGGSFVPSEWVAPAPRRSDRFGLTQEPRAGQTYAPLFDETPSGAWRTSMSRRSSNDGASAPLQSMEMLCMMLPWPELARKRTTPRTFACWRRRFRCWHVYGGPYWPCLVPQRTSRVRLV
jgi:hypothetical protein